MLVSEAVQAGLFTLRLVKEEYYVRYKTENLQYTFYFRSFV